MAFNMAFLSLFSGVSTSEPRSGVRSVASLSQYQLTFVDSVHF